MIKLNFIVFIIFFSRSVLAQVELGDALQVYEMNHEGKVYSIFTINRTDRFVMADYQTHLINVLLIGAREWYLGLHAKQGSFTNPEAMRADFVAGSESFHDGRSTFSIVLEGRAQTIVHELMAEENILDFPEKFYRGMGRISTHSYNQTLPPFYGRLDTLPPGFPVTQGRSIMENDWAELKNLAQDKDLKIDFLPLVLRSIAESGWVDLGGFLRDKQTGEILSQGDPRTIDAKAWVINETETEDASSMYRQSNLNDLLFAPDSARFESSVVENYYLEVLVPESESEGIDNPKKAKGLLAYYYRKGFKALKVLNDPTQPNTKVVIAGIDRKGWLKIIEETKKRRGAKLLKLPINEINFNNPNQVTVKRSGAISCRAMFF